MDGVDDFRCNVVGDGGDVVEAEGGQRWRYCGVVVRAVGGQDPGPTLGPGPLLEAAFPRYVMRVTGGAQTLTRRRGGFFPNGRSSSSYCYLWLT